MQQNIQLHIPEPCHEDWNKMTPTAQGRHCQSCCKQVVDFTTMSDQQIISYLTKASGNTCGRFNSNQLQQPLQSKLAKKTYWKWILSSLAALFFFSSCSNKKATVGVISKPHVDSCVKQKNIHQTMGMPQMIHADTVKKPEVKMMGVPVYINKNDSTLKSKK